MCVCGVSVRESVCVCVDLQYLVSARSVSLTLTVQPLPQSAVLMDQTGSTRRHAFLVLLYQTRGWIKACIMDGFLDFFFNSSIP